METEEEMLQRLKKHMYEEAQVKKRCEERAKRSFQNWSYYTIAKVGRGFGYFIEAPKAKLARIWKWLIN